jgi:hypothetical protein
MRLVTSARTFALYSRLHARNVILNAPGRSVAAECLESAGMLSGLHTSTTSSGQPNRLELISKTARFKSYLRAQQSHEVETREGDILLDSVHQTTCTICYNRPNVWTRDTVRHLTRSARRLKRTVHDERSCLRARDIQTRLSFECRSAAAANALLARFRPDSSRLRKTRSIVALSGQLYLGGLADDSATGEIARFAREAADLHTSVRTSYDTSAKLSLSAVATA